ncbi:MAG TPA: DNA topoisomerase [Lachnospiraceae bacterium]|nr:DNA topoisomerase [Lachnospiraceae bacterium]
MAKTIYIAEKPSVAREFAKALKLNMKNCDGYMESEEAIVTWCVGHLVTMSYPDAYDIKYKKWSFQTLPFLPEEYKYEVIPSAKKQYETVSGLLNRQDVDTIYVCTDSGREGEYIYRLVEMQANVQGKQRKRVWIDSQTEEEILRGIREAKDLLEYDNLSSAAYLRAKEDYLMGINFSRALTLKYGDAISNFLNMKYAVVSVGRVMTCVLGMVVKREREIREFVKTPFFRVLAGLQLTEAESGGFEAEWKAVEGSQYFQSPLLYKENGFKKQEDAENLITQLKQTQPFEAVVDTIEKKKENKNAPLLYNLAELQNDCSKFFKISPDETLRIVQELYEKKAVTYPRTDARVLSTAVSKEIHKNIAGLRNYPMVAEFAAETLEKGTYKGVAKTRYVNDKQITDHYAIIPTGQGLDALRSTSDTANKVYEIIARRFLSIFYPPAVYQKTAITAKINEERFQANFKVLLDEGYMKVSQFSFAKKKPGQGAETEINADANSNAALTSEEQDICDATFLEALKGLKKGDSLTIDKLYVKEGETSPPKRFTSGSIILAMENAGQLIEDDELRAQIKGSGIGTSATRAEILKKLIGNQYLSLNKKTQVITPALMGEMIYDVVDASIKPLLNPELTASWEKGLTGVAEGEITADEYMEKLNGYVSRRTTAVRGLNNQTVLRGMFMNSSKYYKK